MCPEHSNVQATAGVYAEPLQRLARMFAALSATNEAILRTTATDELYQQVCDAALSGGNLIGAAILLHESGTNQLKFTQDAIAAILGKRRATISVAAAALQSQGLIRYSPGSIKIQSRRGLEKAACDCYKFINSRKP